MNWTMTGRGVYQCGDYTISRRPTGRFILMRKGGGALGNGTLQQCKDRAAAHQNPYRAKLANIVGRLLSLDQFQAALSA